MPVWLMVILAAWALTGALFTIGAAIGSRRAGQLRGGRGEDR
jgi:hypothetical protein